VITSNGKRQHLNVIAGKAYSFADRFVLGASSAPMLSNATDLDFSWGSFPISDSIVDEELQQVIFFGTIPAELAGEIKEIGLTTIDSALIATGQPINRTFFFGENEGWVPAADEEVSFSSETSKMGPENLLWTAIAPDEMVKMENINISIADMNLLKAKINATASATLEVTFFSSDTNYARKQINVTAGENFIKTDFSTFTKTAEYDSYSIKAITLKVISGSGNLDMDCLILSNTNNGGLVMREILPNPIVKQSGSSMEIEMAVMLGV